MLAQLSLWRSILQMCVAERLAYRGDFMLGTLMRFLPIVTQIFLWTAVFASAKKSTFSGFTANDVVAYYLLTMVARAFSSMPGLASNIATQIRTGEIKKFMIQPIDLIGFMLVSRVGHKLVYYSVALLPFVLVFYLCGDYFPAPPSSELWVAFLLSLGMSFLLGFYLEATLGMLGFWLLEVNSLLFVYMLFNFFFSGHMFPLDFLRDNLPSPLAEMVYANPLKYLAYQPAAIYLGKIPQSELWTGVAIQAAWTVGLGVACHTALARGYRRYSAYGG